MRLVAAEANVSRKCKRYAGAKIRRNTKENLDYNPLYTLTHVKYVEIEQITEWPSFVALRVAFVILRVNAL